MKVVANKWCKTCLPLGVLTRLKSFPRRTGRSKVLWNRHFVAFPELRCVDVLDMLFESGMPFKGQMALGTAFFILSSPLNSFPC